MQLINLILEKEERERKLGALFYDISMLGKELVSNVEIVNI